MAKAAAVLCGLHVVELQVMKSEEELRQQLCSVFWDAGVGKINQALLLPSHVNASPTVLGMLSDALAPSGYAQMIALFSPARCATSSRLCSCSQRAQLRPPPPRFVLFLSRAELCSTPHPLLMPCSPRLPLPRVSGSAACPRASVCSSSTGRRPNDREDPLRQNDIYAAMRGDVRKQGMEDSRENCWVLFNIQAGAQNHFGLHA